MMIVQLSPDMSSCGSQPNNSYQNDSHQKELQIRTSLRQFEKKFTYPLDAERHFRIDHGDHYQLFYQSMQTSTYDHMSEATPCYQACWAACNERNEVCGTISSVIRDMHIPDE